MMSSWNLFPLYRGHSQQGQYDEQYNQNYDQQAQYGQNEHYYQQYPSEGQYGQNDQYNHQDQYAQQDQYDHQDQYAQGNYAQDQYDQHGQYAQEGPYAQHDQYAQQDQYAPHDQYSQQDQYAQQGQYAQQDQYAQHSQYPQQDQHVLQDQRVLPDQHVLQDQHVQQIQPTQIQQNQVQQFAQQQQAQYQEQKFPPPTRIEMNPVAATTDINEFFAEVTSIQEEMIKLEQNINQIEELHEASLNTVLNEDQAARSSHQLEGITTDTYLLSNKIKNRIKDIELANLRLGDSPDIHIRKTQAATLRDKFLTTLRRYQATESEARKKYQGRMERQYRIVNPEATPEEIEQALDSDNQQIFAQSVLQSTRYGDANRALSEVQSRHDDIKKIERTIIELQQLFNDMEMLVTEQGVVLETVEGNVQQTDNHLEEGNVQVDTAIASARSARKKKWICLGVSLIVVVAIVFIVLGATHVL
ncbi:Plasma membrane t-SNARE, secretory vesicle fusion [Haplosporangium sp. Z 27]|nr:Plasma membrane t-SNARE, secretory vesicle fusion [Haplosporangium sp. Z 27]